MEGGEGFVSPRAVVDNTAVVMAVQTRSLENSIRLLPSLL